MQKPNFLSPQELHRIAMKYVGTELQNHGYEFLAVNSELNRDPQFVCLRPEGGKLFVLVRAITHHNEQETWSEIKTWDKIIGKAAEYEAEIWSTVILIQNEGSINGESPVYRDNNYVLNFSGFEKHT